MFIANIQSDRLEAEFGLYTQMSGSIYFVSVDQVLCSVQLRMLKLFHQLDTIADSSCLLSDCCSEQLSDIELEIIDNSVTSCENLNAEMLAALYYVCGYIARKENVLIG